MKISPPPLPARIQEESKKLNFTCFSEFVKSGKIDEVQSIKIKIDSFELLKENFDIFEKLIASDFNTFYSSDYECLKYIEDHLKDYTNITLSLVDDFQNKDRSYIDANEFKKTNLEIPYSYLMWNPKIKDVQKIALYFSNDLLMPYSTNLFEYVSVVELKRLKDLVEKLNEKYKNYSDLEKVILVSNYIQNLVQFVDENNISEASDGVYITSSGLYIPTSQRVGSSLTVLFDNHGICNGIANATTTLLNNPLMNVNVRSIFGCSHAWNYVNIDGKYYLVDNTWNITRNKDRYEESLKARSFCSDYLFFGSKTASEISHHDAKSYLPNIEEDDMDRKIIQEKQMELSKTFKFSDYNKPVFESHLQR